MLQQEPLSLLLEEETDAQRGHSLCHGTGALGFYCGLSVPFVTTRQHCLFLSLRSKQSGREASVGGLVIYCNLGTRCWGAGAPCGGWWMLVILMFCCCRHPIYKRTTLTWRDQSGGQSANVGDNGEEGVSREEVAVLNQAILKLLVYRELHLLV